MAFIEGLFCTQTVHLGPGLYIIVVLYSGAAIKNDLRGTCVCVY